jgi:CRISPR-associated protein Csa3
MEETTHIVPVGFTKETLVESLRRHPVTRVILLSGDNPKIETEKRARQTIKEVKSALGSIPSEEIYLDLNDIPGSALKVISLIHYETSNGRKVLLNLSGSLRSLDLACYMAALATKTKVYVGIPDYKENILVGVKAVQDIPLFPIKPYMKEKKEILCCLKEGEKSLEDIIDRLRPKLKKRTQAYLTERSRISHHLKDLKEDGLADTIKEGKTIQVKLSKLGELYLEGQY